jgi:hypothetical protein
MSPVPPLPAYADAGPTPSAHVRLPILLLLLGVLVAAVAVWAPAAEQRASSERSYALTRDAQQMPTAMLDQETGLRGYILTAARRFLAPDDGADASTLVRAADRALYRAKADGRDCVVAAAQIERVMPPSTASVSPVT